jgi:hypothetical protein
MGVAANLDGSCQPLVSIGTGLPALPKKIVEKIRASEYVDFSELPPAKGKGRPLPQSLEGQIIVVQAADLIHTRRIIPDLATWCQCFVLYTATVVTAQPSRLLDLMAYQSLIAKASQKYKWPSWVVYYQNFRQDAAGNPKKAWAEVDPSIYAQCFTGQAVSGENWCSKCQCLDHNSAGCPFRPRKRPWGMAHGAAGVLSTPTKERQVCHKFNRYDGDCKFGKECHFLHVCSVCKEPHPVSRCKGGYKGGSSSAGT